jgi:Protein of unknown function (DUF2934)
VIDSKSAISSKPVHSLPPQSLIEDETLLDWAIRTRAYQLYELRGNRDGCADQDWYQAQAELRSRSKQS